MIRLSHELLSAVRIQETAKTLICTELGTKYRALSADSSTAMGLSPQFVVFDELGQVRGPRSPLFEALESATGALADPLAVIISTQASSDSDLLSMLIDDAMTGEDPSTVLTGLFRAGRRGPLQRTGDSGSKSRLRSVHEQT
jgi:hypothetical protein